MKDWMVPLHTANASGRVGGMNLEPCVCVHCTVESLHSQEHYVNCSYAHPPASAATLLQEA